MKKIFSAFLLMTMMVFSVGSFVACSDLENEIAAVDQQTTENAEAIADLNSKLTSLQTALAAAQADADAAMKAADAAKAAAATAKAEAIEAAKAEVEKAIADLQAGHKTDIDAVNAKVKAVEDALALKADKATVDLLAATLEEYKKAIAEDGDLWKAVSALQEQIVNLQGSLQAQEMTLEDLQAAVDQLVADMKAINTNLVSVYNLVEALANQIQSIVYVPETIDGQATVAGYVLGTANDAKKTDLLVKMTYEVSPKGLASAVTAETAAMSTVTVKAADAEYFNVEIADADPATGRVVVYAHIPAKTEAYKQIEAKKNIALSLNVAEAKMISLLMGDEPEILDAGTYVQSSYVTAKPAATLWDNIYDNFCIYDTVKKEAVTGKVNPKIEVPYNTAPAVTELFANYDVRVAMEGAYMTVEEAAAFTGFEFELKNEFKVKYFTPKNEAIAADDAKNNPFTVTGTDFAATAQFANVEKVKDAALVGYYLMAESYKYTVNKQKIAGHVTATYVITEKKSDFGFSPINVAWKHTYGLNVTVPAQELAVNGTDFDITKTDINNSDFVATWKYLDADGKEKTATAKAKVSAMSSKAVKLISIDALPFTKGAETTYTFKGNVIYNKVNYTVSFDVVLGAMPTDKTIDLNGGQPINIDASIKAPITINNVTPVSQALAWIAETDSTVPELKDFDIAKSLVAGTKKVKVDGKDASASIVTINNSKKTENNTTSENSTVVVNGLTKYENTITVSAVYTLYGVNFTYTATIVTSKPTVSFAPAAAYVTSDNKVNLDGTVKFEYADANKTATKASTKYTLNAIDLRNYVDVTIPTALKDDFVLRYTLKTPYKTADNKDIKVGDHVLTANDLAKFADGTITPKKVAAFNYTTVGNTTTATPVACPITWPTDLREMVYEIALVSTTPTKDTNNKDVDNVFGSFEVTLVVPEVIKTFAADKEIKVKYENGKTATANIAGAFNVVDKFDNVIYNAYAPTLEYIWDGYKLDTAGKLAQIQNAGFYNAYNQSIVLPAAKDIKAYMGATDVTSQVNPVLATDGTLTIQPESATLTGDVVVKVPVKLTYAYDEFGTKAQSAEVSVVFSLTEGEVQTPGADVTFDTPDGKQWVADGISIEGLLKDTDAKTPYVYDFGKATVTGYYGSDYENVHSVGIYQETLYTHEIFDWMTGDVTGTVNFKADTYYSVAGPTAYKFVPTDATSGVILYQYYAPVINDNATSANDMYMKDPTTGKILVELDSDVHELKYSHYTGETVKFYTTEWVNGALTEVATEYKKVATPVDTFVFQALN